MNYKDIADYIIAFLLREENESQPRLSPLVGYTRNPEEMKLYKVVIYPSDFFEVGVYATEKAYPSLPSILWNNIPLLFGEPKVKRINEGKTLVLYADLIASTYFLISRYEEMYFRGKRDAYHRFPGKESYPYKAGFIDRPIVEEYGESLMQILEAEGVEIDYPKKGFAQINFTHDIDRPYEYCGVRSFLRALLREKKSLSLSFRLAFQNILKDRFWSFPRFLEWNKEVSRLYPGRSRTILFYKTPGTKKEDRPNYRISSYPISKIHQLATKYGADEGWHIPLSFSEHPRFGAKIVHKLEKELQHTVKEARYHFLAMGEPEDAIFLYKSGIRDDYTLGYADVAGFRLGTCRPVRFILPNTGEITHLLLHPLTLMEFSLMRPNYMNLSEKEALNYARKLLEAVVKHRGELNLLFHNESLAKEVSPAYSTLYREILRTILHLDPIDEPIITEHTSEGYKPWHNINPMDSSEF